MKQGRELNDLFGEVQSRAEAMEDYILPARDIKMTEDGQFFQIGDQGLFRPTNHMLTQVRENIQEKHKNDLRAPYCNASRGVQTPYGDLLAINLNAWLVRTDGNQLVRTYNYRGDGDSIARAMLSDRFYRLDYMDLLQSVLPDMLPYYEQGRLQFVSCEVTDVKLYMKFIIPALRKEIRRARPGEGHITNLNDVIDFGGEIGTSEVGSGYCFANTFSVVQWCNNGAVHTKYGTQRRHIGKRITMEEEQHYSAETIQMDDAAFWAKFKEDTRHLLQGVYAHKIIEDIERAAGFDIPHAGNAVTVLKKKWGLTNEQHDSILNHFTSGKHFTSNLWGLSNAVTSMAAEQDDYDLATLFEERGADILNFTRMELKELVAE